MKKLYHFVYLTTNLIDGKKYVGDHSSNNPEKDTYIGSGTVLRKAIKKHGRKSFKCEKLEFFSSKEESFAAQEKYIALYETHVSQNGYNISWKGGLLGNDSHSDESKKKISENSVGFSGRHHTQESKDKIRIGNTGKPSPRKNVELTIETKEKMSKGGMGRTPWNKGMKMNAEFCKKTKIGIDEKRSVNEKYINRFD